MTKHVVKIVSVVLREAGMDTGVAHPSDTIEIGFKCEARRSTTVEEFTRGDVQPLFDFIGYEKLSQLRGFEFGVDSEERETIGFRRLIKRARTGMTPLETLFERATTAYSHFERTDLNTLNPRALERLFTEVFAEDGLLGPIAQIFRESGRKTPKNGAPGQ